MTEPVRGPQTRRRFLFSATAALGFVAGAGNVDAQNARLKIMITGGHPGDPECGCGGSIARLTGLGHEAVVVYLNRGEGYCGGRELGECGPIRTAEAVKACQILKARPVFLTQVDGRAVVDNTRYEEFAAVFDREKPDVLFAQWPIDSHRDHRALSALVLDAWLKQGKKSALYYYEVTDDTMMFTPTDYVNISTTESKRHDACYAHASQKPDKWYPQQAELTRFRGSESGYSVAEAFARHRQSPRGLPF